MRNTDMLLARGVGADGVVRKYRTAGDWAGMVQRSFAGRAEPHLLSVPAVPLDALRCFRSKRVADDFAKHLLQANAQAENVNSTGGAVVPSGQVSDDLIALRDSAGITPKLCDVQEMASNHVDCPSSQFRIHGDVFWRQHRRLEVKRGVEQRGFDSQKAWLLRQGIRRVSCGRPQRCRRCRCRPHVSSRLWHR